VTEKAAIAFVVLAVTGLWVGLLYMLGLIG
jgi:hypothetical protein